MPDPSIEFTQTGRGGSIFYNEGQRTVSFEWEFSASPALAVITGPGEAVWDQMHVWAAGRQEEIFYRVGKEVLRQKAPGYQFSADLANGTITISPNTAAPALVEAQATDHPPLVEAPPTKLPRRDKHTKAYKRFMAGVPKGYEGWGDEQCYDVAAIPKMNAAERKETFALLQRRDLTWREVEAFAVMTTPEAREAIQAALQHHLSIDVRLAAASALDRQGSMENIEAFLARQIRLLHNPRSGLRRALAMAEQRPTDTIQQALLWASINQTECAPHCARRLIKLTGAAPEPLGPELEEMLSNLGLHNSYFTRQAAFEKLCKRVGIVFDPSASDL